MIAEGPDRAQWREADDAGDPAQGPRRRDRGRKAGAAPAAATRLFRFYKPQAHDHRRPRHRRAAPTIYDRLPKGLPRLMPVGRLDFMTEGLLLLTNDGELKRQLELPQTGVVRTYRARGVRQRHARPSSKDSPKAITIEGMHYGSINANLERRTGRNCWVEMSLTEGKNREVRRVLAHLGLQVSRLIRTAYGPFTLAGLEPGDVDEVDRGGARAVPHVAEVRIIAGRVARAVDRGAARAGHTADCRPCARNPVLNAHEPPRIFRGSARRRFVCRQRRAGLRSAVARRGSCDLRREGCRRLSRRSGAMPKSSARPTAFRSSAARRLACRAPNRST